MADLDAWVPSREQVVASKLTQDDRVCAKCERRLRHHKDGRPCLIRADIIERDGMHFGSYYEDNASCGVDLSRGGNSWTENPARVECPNCLKAMIKR